MNNSQARQPAQAHDLLGDPLPEPLPAHSRLTDADQLVGHEVRAVFTDTVGTYGHAEMVIVTATGCWLAMDIQGVSLEDAELTVIRPYSSKPVELIGYVPASQLRSESCVTDSEYHRLKALEDEHKETERQHKETERQRKANRLRQELAELEGQNT